MRLRAAGGLALLALAAWGCGGAERVERVVLITVDTTRADRLGCYGYDEAGTPHLDALASEGVLFENAVSPVPTTLPAHSSLFTGRYPQDHGVRYNLFYKLPPEAQTLAETLSAAGWSTAAFPASHIVAARFGLDQGFDRYVEPQGNPEPDIYHPVRGNSRPAAEGVDLTLAWLDEQRDAESFVWLHLYDPHWPYQPPFPYSSQYRERPYDGEIAYMDAQIGRLLDALRADPAWDRTLVVVAGDHGEGLYDHDERWHTMLVYETTQHVPLIVRAPGAGARRVDAPVSLVDLMPTILDLAGVEAPASMRGVSLRPALEGDAMPPRRDLYAETLAGSLIYGWQELHVLRSGPWKLIDSEAPELFDLSQDPAEERNLAALEPERLAELRTALATLRRGLDGDDPQAAAEPDLDPETLAMLESLGYVGGGGGGSAVGAPHPHAMVDLEPELLSAQAAVARQDWGYVENLCRYTLERDATNKWALVNRTTALLHQGREDEALEHARVMPRIYPDNDMGYAKLAEVWAVRGDHARAWQVLQDGLEHATSSELLGYLSLVTGFDAGRDGLCAGEVPAAVERWPSSPRVRILEARCQARAGELDAALGTLERATELGFRQFEVVESAAEFASVVASPRYTALRERFRPATANEDAPRDGA